jgi:outer membrane receptor for ferrienterochelin and colicins
MFRQNFLAGAAVSALLTSMVPAFGQSSSDAAADPGATVLASSPNTVVAQSTASASGSTATSSSLDTLVAQNSASAPSVATSGTGLETVTVTAQRLAQAQIGIQTQLGASTYTLSTEAIQNLPGGENSLLNSVILQMPSVAQDSFGQFHIRGEHNALQYRLDGIILPEGISVFGQTLDPRLAQSVELIDGALPAEYGLETGGIVNIQTKTGLFNSGGEVTMYGGSHDELYPSFSYGGSSGNFNYFVSGDYLTNGIGIESPDSLHTPDHDRTQQWHGFAFLQDILDQESSVALVLGTSHDMFQIPNLSGPFEEQPSGVSSTFSAPSFVGLGPVSPSSGLNVLQADGQTAYPSDQLNERQREITHYGTLSYLRSAGPVDFQLAVFGRFSSLYYTAGDNLQQDLGELLYDGYAQNAYKRDVAYGTQDEGAWHLGDHTVRFGVFYEADDLDSRTSTLVLPTASGGPSNPNPNPLCSDPANICQISDVPETIPESGTKHAWQYSFYVQDEWKIFPIFTVNYGLRWDQYSAFSSGNQLSPRINGVLTPFDGTTLHVGYARYFSPPPIELVGTTEVAPFANTTNAPAVTADATPLAERADYYDAGASQQITDALKVNIDSYYKLSKDLIDEGQFGAPIILTPFNYAHGRQYGAELSADYASGNWTAYGNFSLEHAIGIDWITSQFDFAPDDLAYVQNNYIHLDHEQLASASAGVTYKWGTTVFSSDMIYGTGLREDTTAPDGSTIPNGAHTAPYTSVNVGVKHDFSDIGWDGWSAQATIVNLFDVDYLIRSGTGVGVFAPQYGQRRGFFAGLTKSF